MRQSFLKQDWKIASHRSRLRLRGSLLLRLIATTLFVLAIRREQNNLDQDGFDFSPDEWPAIRPRRVAHSRGYDPITAAMLGYKTPSERPRGQNTPRIIRASWLRRFRGSDSPATVALSFLSLFSTILLSVVVIFLNIQSNRLIERQNELVLIPSLPDLSASVIRDPTNQLILTITNQGSRANFQTIQPLTLIRFTFTRYNGSEEAGFIPIHGVFQSIHSPLPGSGNIAAISSAANTTEAVNELCAAIVPTDHRINECSLDTVLVVSYQTNTERVWIDYYLVEQEVSFKVSRARVEARIDRWEEPVAIEQGTIELKFIQVEGIIPYVQERVNVRASKPTEIPEAFP